MARLMAVWTIPAILLIMGQVLIFTPSSVIADNCYKIESVNCQACMQSEPTNCGENCSARNCDYVVHPPSPPRWNCSCPSSFKLLDNVTRLPVNNLAGNREYFIDHNVECGQGFLCQEECNFTFFICANDPEQEFITYCGFYVLAGAACFGDG